MASSSSSSPSSEKDIPPSRSIDRSGASTPTVSVPTSAVDKTPDDSSKLRTFLSILKKFIGVSDIASVRFSLPAQLMEPIPNLEYWHYMDQPDAFASIGDSDEPLGRMLNALRFWFTKDLKFVKGKPVKPYNSCLGEFFRCNWDVTRTIPPVLGNIPKQFPKITKSPIKISYLTEQTSHHPPVSAYFIECPEKGISARGFDQISVNFTGTRIRVAPGNYNHGIFITLHNHANETYHLTHPIAHLGGLLKGTPSITVGDTCFVTCSSTKLKAILHYQEEGWIGKTQNKMQGIIFKYDPNNDTKTRAKDVSDSDIIARIEDVGTNKSISPWAANHLINQYGNVLALPGMRLTYVKDKKLIVDLSPMMPEPKIIPPENDQLPNESRKIWAPVTEAILNKQYTAATDAKQEIEERQRQKAAERKARNVEWAPRFFTAALTPPGKPELTKEGKDALQKLQQNDFKLEPSFETGA